MLPKHAGGFDANMHTERLATKVLFEALCSPFAQALSSALTIGVRLTRRWRCAWPRPKLETDGLDQLSFRIVEGNVLLLDFIQNLDRCPPADVVSKWKRTLVCLFAQREKVGLSEFLQMTVLRLADIGALVAQIVWHLSVALEAKLGKASQGSSLDALQFTWVSAADSFAGPTLDRKLAQYVLGARDMLKNEVMFAYGGDKAIVCKLPLRTSFLATPSNLACVCNPVVLPCTLRSLSNNCLEFRT
jgi:hypothetical protein